MQAAPERRRDLGKVAVFSLLWFSGRVTLLHRGHLALSGDILGCQDYRVGIQWVQARDAVKHPTTQGMALTMKNDWPKMPILCS